MCVTMHVWRSENHLQESLLTHYLVEAGRVSAVSATVLYTPGWLV